MNSQFRVPLIPPLDELVMQLARERQAQLTKPLNSLGRIEDLAIRLVGMTGKLRPSLSRRSVLVFAGDHGVTAEGVSAYPAEVTPQMVYNFLRGGAAISVLARQIGARLTVVDVGVQEPISPMPGLISARVRPGTANFAQLPAMTHQEAVAALQVGIEAVETELAEGVDVLILGEMGIGNTTAASAIVAALTGERVETLVGRGTGIDDVALERKIAAIRRGLELHRPDPDDPIDVLAKVGGLEIAALTGAMLAAASARVPVILDGFITGAAALAAVAFDPAVRDYMIAAHRSVEPGHILILERLDLYPLLDLRLRLGEASGAALAAPLLDAAIALLNDMATFAEAGVSERIDAPESEGSRSA